MCHSCGCGSPSVTVVVYPYQRDNHHGRDAEIARLITENAAKDQEILRERQKNAELARQLREVERRNYQDYVRAVAEDQKRVVS